MAYLLQHLQTGSWLRYELPTGRVVMLTLGWWERESPVVRANTLADDGTWGRSTRGDVSGVPPSKGTATGDDTGTATGKRGCSPGTAANLPADNEGALDGSSAAGPVHAALAAAPIPDRLPESALAVVVPLLPPDRPAPVRYLLLPCCEPPHRNAEPVPCSDAVVLGDGDCLTWRRPDAAVRVFFDGFQPARILPYSGDESPCPVCDTTVARESPAVVCPGCGVAYHQSAEAACYEMVSGCSSCGSQSRLGASSSWHPSGLPAPESSGRALGQAVDSTRAASRDIRRDTGGEP